MQKCHLGVTEHYNLLGASGFYIGQSVHKSYKRKYFYLELQNKCNFVLGSMTKLYDIKININFYRHLLQNQLTSITSSCFVSVVLQKIILIHDFDII